MKKCAAIVLFCLAITCGGNDVPLTANCKPFVNVTVPPVPKSKHATPASARDVVQVYWDVSSSMRDFARVKRASKTAEEEADDLTPVVNALDSSVLLNAHAQTVEQYGVGETIAPLASAAAALRPTAKRTALHLAAEQIGTALASGTADAAVVVSDMELDTPPRASTANATVCGGVHLPATPLAGSLFGRCFESATLAAGDARLTRTNLLAHVFRKSSHGRELFILVLATNREFGRRISDEMVKRLDFSRSVIFDSGAVAASNVRECRLTAPDASMLRTANGCGAKCFDATAQISGECDLQQVTSAWVYPTGRGADGVAFEVLKKAPKQKADAARVQFAIPCSTPPGRFEAMVSFDWRRRAIDESFAEKASVRDLFDSLSDAIARTSAPRRLRIGIELSK